MIDKTLIKQGITPLKPMDSAAVALSWMDDYKVAHLPVVDNMEFQGLISEKDIFESSDFDAPVSEQKIPLSQNYVLNHQHFFEVIRMMAEDNLTLVPVLDQNKHYLGSITLKTMVDYMAEMTAVRNPGGVIVLEMSTKDYSISEIAQIVESNDAKILSLSLTSHSDSTKLEVTLKLNKMDIGAVLQTFNRYEYQVKASYSKTNDESDDLRERYDSLMKYLNI